MGYSLSTGSRRPVDNPKIQILRYSHERIGIGNRWTREAGPGDLKRASKIVQVLSHPSRLRIVCEMSDGQPTTRKALIARMGRPQSTMARHLKALRDLGLITATRKGQEVVLEVGSPVAGDLMSAVCDWVHPETGEHFTSKHSDLVGKGVS